jgi:alkyl hydroperoxide reductase subunit AhpC
VDSEGRGACHDATSGDASKPEFDKRNVRIIALSVDPVESHSNWANDIEETQGLAPNYPSSTKSRA